MTDNLELWAKVEKTPVEHTKEISGKSYKGNSPKPHYLIRKATETFGPAGIGWGFHVVDERIEEGAGGEKLHIARVKVWYKWKGERGEVEHIGGTQFSGIRSNGKPFTDEDAPKKSVTDALVKALSMIGFAGDIFLGRYDDSKYVSDLKEEARERKREEAASHAPEPRQQTKKPTHPASFDDHSLMVELRAISSMHGLKSFWMDNIGTFKAMGQEALDAFTAAKDERKAAIEAAPKPKQPDTVDDILDTFPGSTVTNERIINTQGRELHPLEGM